MVIRNYCRNPDRNNYKFVRQDQIVKLITMTLLQIWLVRLAVVGLSGLCFVFGGLTARKGLRVLRSGNVDDKVRGPLASDSGAQALFLGAFVFLFGFGLLYILTMF